MSTVSDSYDTLVRGVSQQVPDKRVSGQHWTQDNMIPDPVRGLRRRPGTRRLSETVVVGDLDDIATNYRNFDTQADGREVALLCRRPGTTGTSQPVYATQRGDFGASVDAQVLPVSLTTTAAGLLDDGVHAVTSVGKFILFAHTHTIGSTTEDKYTTDVNQRRVVISVKGGSHGRTYTVKIKRVAGSAINVSYTVPNLYNSDGSVNAAAAVAVQPNSIAGNLQALLAAAGGWSGNFTMTRRGSTLIITPSTTLEYVNTGDGGDNTQITATWRVVQDPADLPPTATVGHVVQVYPRTGEEKYYLRAEADDNEPDKVVWREYTAAEVSLVDPFCIGYVHNNTLYVGANPTDLQTVLDAAGATVDVPELGKRKVGDDDSMPPPHFVGRAITDMVVFQDRLLVACGPVVNASQIAQYFNFWRSTVLTYPDDDAVEMYASGSEADTIYGSVIFDRSLVFFGDKQQYAISGKVPLTGATATIMQSSAHKDAAGVRPVALGDLLFFLKAGKSYTAAYQIAVGNVEDTSNSTEISRALNDYIYGQGREMVGLSLPEMLLIRTTSENTVYTFNFIDQGQQRLQEAWGRWTFDTRCGKLAGLSTHKDFPRFLFVKQRGAELVLVVDELDLLDTTNTVPHLDSYFFNGDFAADSNLWVAYAGDADEDQRWFGRRDYNVAALTAEFGASDKIVRGYQQPTPLVRLTSPYVVDNNDKPVTGGVLTVTSLSISVADSGAMRVVTELPWGEQPGLDWTGRVLGRQDNLVGYRTLRDDEQSVIIGQINTNYIARIEAVDWRPLTLTGVSWKGQYFKRARSL